MRSLWDRQSELFAASAIFYAMGGVLSVLLVTVFRDPTSPLIASTVVTAVLSFLLAAVFLIRGRRVRTVHALTLLCLAAVLVLAMVPFSPTMVRAMNPALLFYTFLFYLVWFGPMRLARGFGYLWLAAYGGIMLVRFDSEVWPYLTTVVVTSIVLCELVGAYKNRLQAHSLTDPLCGVWNQRGFSELVEGASQAVRRTGQPLGLLYIDMDELKRLNDTLGHAEGDRVLRAFASDLDRLTRPQDSVARLGGDEFAVLLPGSTERETRAAGERLRREIVEVGWSFGATELRPGEPPSDFIARADELMLLEKRRRKAERASGV